MPGDKHVPMRIVNLTDDELLLLDGKVNAQAQADIDAIKRDRAAVVARPDLSPNDAIFVAKVVHYARVTGRVGHSGCTLAECAVCGATATYPAFKRDGRTHRKGQPDTSKSKRMLYGIEFAHRGFITFGGWPTLGCCNACVARVQPEIVKALVGVKAEIPDVLARGAERWRYYENQRCKKCGWVGHTGEIGKKPALLGGHYPGVCPACKAESAIFGDALFEAAPGYVLLPVDLVAGVTR